MLGIVPEIVTDWPSTVFSWTASYATATVLGPRLGEVAVSMQHHAPAGMSPANVAYVSLPDVSMCPTCVLPWQMFMLMTLLSGAAAKSAAEATANVPANRYFALMFMVVSLSGYVGCFCSLSFFRPCGSVSVASMNSSLSSRSFFCRSISSFSSAMRFWQAGSP